MRSEGRAVCPHRVARQFCGLCGGWGGDFPAQADVEEETGYLMVSGDWQLALWNERVGQVDEN